MEGRDPTEFTLGEKAGFITQGILSGKIFELAKPANLSLWRELSGYFARPEVKAALARETAEIAEPERRTFIMANAACEQLAFRCFEKFVEQIRAGKVIESLQALTSIAPILVVLAPYIYAFHSQAPSRRWLRQVMLDFTGAIPPILQNREARLVYRHPRGGQRRRDDDSQNGRGSARRRRATHGCYFLRRAHDRRSADQEFQTDRRIRAAGVRATEA